MTFRSLKNLRIIRLSRQAWTASLSLAGLATLCLGNVAAQPGQRYLLTIENNQPRIRQIDGVRRTPGSSLDRLKERSAEQRFEQMRKEQDSSILQREPLPLLEPAESAPIPDAPPAPAKTRLPRLPEVEELERNEPFVSSQKQIQNQSARALPPTQTSNPPPRLPDLDELEEFDPFASSPPQLHSVQPQQPPAPISHAVPAPAPTPLPQLETPVYSTLQEDELLEEADKTTPPDTVRSLSTIRPTYDYQFAVKNEYQYENRTPTDPMKVPEDADYPVNAYTERISPDSLFAWEASNLFHNPLYFEDPTLERYGHVHPCVQPLVSLTRMGVQLVGLPYQSVIDTPWTKRYTLGWYRPGEPAPHLHYQIPLNPEAALAEGLAITGGFLVIP